MAGFLYYRIADKQLLGNSGYSVHQIPYEEQEPILDETGQPTGQTQAVIKRRDFTGQDGIEIDVLPNYGGVLEDYGCLELTDDEMKQCYAAANYEIEFDVEDNPTGFVTYARVVLTCPATATIGVAIDIAADYEGMLYIDGEQQTAGTAWQVQFDSVGTYLVEVDAGKHGKASQEVVVE